MTVDLEKLQKLSCLSIAAEQKLGVEKSIEGVIGMMEDVAALGQTLSMLPRSEQSLQGSAAQLPSSLPSGLTPEALRTADNNQNTNLISNQNNNVNLSDGYFLAPKAIKR